MSNVIDLTSKFLIKQEKYGKISKARELADISYDLYKEYIELRKSINNESKISKKLMPKFKPDYSSLYYWNSLIFVISEISDEDKFVVKNKIMSAAYRTKKFEFKLSSIKTIFANFIIDSKFGAGAFDCICESTKVCNQIADFKEKMLERVDESDILFFEVYRMISSDFIIFSYLDNLVRKTKE
jgi:hypothetical protein